MPRHKFPVARATIILPGWIEAEDNDCLRSIAEEVYSARALAVAYGAVDHPSCREVLAAGDKALAVLNDGSVTDGGRCKAGERALRKFWEAKTCARRNRDARRSV